MCLGKDVIEISSDWNERSGDSDSPEYKDTARSGGKKEPEALVFHRTLRRIVIVKLCLEYEVRKGKKLVKKELMVSLRGEIYFVQFIINPEEDEFKPGLIFERSFLRSAKGGLRSDENFNAREYWEMISTDGDLHLMTGYEKIQKNDMWLLSMFEARHQNGDLDRTTLRELIDSDDRLIPDISVDDVPRVAAQRALRVQRASMQDLYERVYNVSLLGDYNPPGYAQPQYNQYYQQYYPQQPPQYQYDDEENKEKDINKMKASKSFGGCAIQNVHQPSGPIESVANEVFHKELGDSLVKVGTTTFSLKAEQDSCNVTKTESKATPNEPSSQGTDSGGGLMCQETIGGTIAQTRQRPLKKEIASQQDEIASLKRRVKKL
nr:hypothetical protein [Tanacetum cinerariifolium]